MERGIRPGERIAAVDGGLDLGIAGGLLWCFALIGGIMVLGNLVGLMHGDEVNTDLVVPWVGTVLALIAVSWWDHRTASRLRRDGVRISAAVSTVEYQEHGDGNPGWLVVYSYETNLGALTGELYFDGAAAPHYPGEPIPIVYDPDKPWVNGWLEPLQSGPGSQAAVSSWRSVTAEEVIALLGVVLVAVGLLNIVVRAYDDPSSYGTVTGALFVAWGVLCFGLIFILNVGPDGTRLVGRAVRWFVIGLAAVVFIEFGVLTTSALNH
jgi:hypothetical protein